MARKPPQDKKQRNRDILRAVSHFSQIGFTITSCILVGVLLGKFLDDLLGSSPWLLLLFSLLGAGAALKSLFDLPGGGS